MLGYIQLRGKQEDDPKRMGIHCEVEKMSLPVLYFMGVFACLLVIALTDPPPWSWNVPIGLLLICVLWPLLVVFGWYLLFRPVPHWWVLLLRWLYSSDHWEGRR